MSCGNIVQNHSLHARGTGRTSRATVPLTKPRRLVSPTPISSANPTLPNRPFVFPTTHHNPVNPSPSNRLVVLPVDTVQPTEPEDPHQQSRALRVEAALTHEESSDFSRRNEELRACCSLLEEQVSGVLDAAPSESVAFGSSNEARDPGNEVTLEPESERDPRDEVTVLTSDDTMQQQSTKAATIEWDGDKEVTVFLASESIEQQQSA